MIFIIPLIYYNTRWVILSVLLKLLKIHELFARKNICICFDGLEKQNNELIRDFAAEYTDIRNNFWTNNDDDNINNFEKPQQNIKLKVPIVEFDYKFEEKNIGSTLNTSVKDFSAKSISWGKLRDEIKQESIENESYDESQNLDMNIKSNKTKAKIDSNLFLVRRAWFRGFSEYYKNLFARANYSWQRKRGNKKKKTPMMTLIREFAESEFGDLISKLTESQWNKFRTTLFTILFSHRYKKDDEFLKGIDFTQVRSVLYHYTTEARVDFLKNPQFWYLIHHFYLKNRGQFLQSKQDDGRKLSIIELDTELSILHEESLTTLQRQSPF